MAERAGSDSTGSGAAPAPAAAWDFQAVLAIADALPMPIAYLDAGRRYRFVNRALAEFFERPRSEILGATMEELVGPEVYAIRKPMLAAAYGGERQFFVAEYEHPTRGPLSIQAEYIPQHAADGSVAGIVALVTDVTEQKLAEKALRESEERFRRIANSAPAMMWVTRLDRTRDFVNDAYMEFTGLSREEAQALDWRTRIHPDDVDRIVRESIAGEASQRMFTLEGRYQRFDGEWRWLRSVSQPRFGPEGELVGFIGVASDVTLAKEAELNLMALVESQAGELAVSEQRFRAIFDTVLEVIVLLDPEGTVLELNHKSAVWRDPEPRKAIGKKIWDSPTLIAYPQHVPTMKRGIKAAAKGELFNEEVKMEREGVATAFLDVAVQPIRDPAGKVVYLLFEARDVTELKAAQEQLRQSQKMEALGQLTGGIAHDFNNLLTVVVGGLDLIEKNVKEERLKRYAANALTAAERGARLTAQLLAFSRVQRLEVKPTHVAVLIDAMRPLLRNVLGPTIEKKFDLDEAMIPVMADPTQLELAVLNLAINARDAMPDGGVLSFTTAKVDVEGDPELADGDYIELAVSDTGEGMGEDVIARAFEPFFTTKEVGKGTGLGLSMVYGVARQSGGTARIESRPGEGTTVRLYFRRAEESAEEVAEAATVAKGRRRKASVLVVDDDPDVREFIAASLADFGYAVREAVDGVEGLKAFEEKRPDLVILDYAMPGMNGSEVASRMLREVPGQPILFVSGYNETEAIRAAAPDAQLLAKPFRPDALDAAVRDCLEKGKNGGP
ncbi:hybrid sensor histidine kinase/response regulator [Sphingomonas alba]|uniref:histidine kinase n=1 Tax=Sphingomonas alba TaxID=2908208 RepID=A0ABT0RLN9_9SPHN|nr:PAS domain S-box protein [Sphingomonas alba]MCL6683538.1 PAS domain S-box protein [Sphingomonas alba]